MSSPMGGPNGPPYRKGKWTDEENAYVEKLVVRARAAPAARRPPPAARRPQDDRHQLAGDPRTRPRA